LAYIQDLIIKPPFSELFTIDENVLQAIVKNILENTYDESQPIVVWKDKNIVIDGHTRLKASQLAGRQIISVFNKAFRNQEEALQYAINNQRNRRNMSEAELLRCIEAVDKRQERGGDRKSEEAKSKTSSEVIDKPKSSAEETARIVGTSRAKVERARTVLADPEAKGEVLAGKKTISRAAKEVKRKRNRKPKSKPGSPNPLNEDTRPIRLMEAWEELRMWRNRYAHLGDEFREVFSIIDAKGAGENLR
jgi:ParB family chromosome partitioning protein